MKDRIFGFFRPKTEQQTTPSSEDTEENNGAQIIYLDEARKKKESEQKVTSPFLFIRRPLTREEEKRMSIGWQEIKRVYWDLVEEERQKILDREQKKNKE